MKKDPKCFAVTFVCTNFAVDLGLISQNLFLCKKQFFIERMSPQRVDIVFEHCSMRTKVMFHTRITTDTRYLR